MLLPTLITKCLEDHFNPANTSSDYASLSPGLKECIEDQMQSLKEVKQDIASIKETQSFQSDMFDKLSSKQKSMDEKLTIYGKKIRELEELVYDLEEDLDYTAEKLEEQERRSRLDNLEFHGLAPSVNEDTDKLVIELKFSKNDVAMLSSGHRTGEY
uniref:uncharacterized protein LOC120338132 n=1 Tax=Styela clava TaxID=7725 RepID=UPI0019395CF5|nr:uncharacterized protein LOC120338132 [Styela clava]